MRFIADQLEKMVQVQPNALFSSYKGQETTYEAFYLQAKKLAHHLQEKGYQKENILALLLPNSDHFLVCYYACQIAGFTVLPINTKLAAREIEYILTHSNAKGLIYDKRFEDTINEVLPATSVETRITTGYSEGSNRLEDILQGSNKTITVPQANDEDTAVIFYTSGTTGRPKGVMLTNKNVAAVATIWQEAMEITNKDRMHIVAPLFHCAASHVFTVPTVYAGGSVIIEEGFSPEQTLQTMEKKQVTIFFGVPAMYNILLTNPKINQASLPNLRLLTYGAAPMPYENIKRVKQTFPNVKVQNLYGQTENAPAATTLKDEHALSKIGSVGQALPLTEVRIVNEDGQEMPLGEVGEIIVKGPQVMKGYLNNEQATRETVKDGWLYSGDLGRLDEEGLLYIVDRKKDMIIRGGENIYPVEIEEVLYEIPELLEAAVIGIPDEVLGEVPKAFVVMKEGTKIDATSILQYCQSRLAKYKLPQEVTFIDSLPRNASGKVLKTNLRTQQPASQ